MAKKPIRSVYILVDEDNNPLELHFSSADDALDYYEAEEILENCGPCRVFRFAAQEEAVTP